MRQNGKRCGVFFLLISMTSIFLGASLIPQFSNYLQNKGAMENVISNEVSTTIIFPRIASQATNLTITEVCAEGTTSEWYEIYNPLSVDINVSNWKIIDPNNSPAEDVDLGGNVTVYNGDSNITAGQIITIGDAGSGANIEVTDGIITLTEGGDELVIINEIGEYQDVIIWGTGGSGMKNTWYWATSNTAASLSSSPGASLERINRSLSIGALEDNNIETDWNKIAPTTPGILPQYHPPNASLGLALISEVMYGGDGAEWIEIQNNCTDSLNIGGCVLTAFGNGNETTIPIQTILEPYATYVVTDLSFKDAGDVILLRNSSGYNLDAVVWGNGNDTFVIGNENGWVDLFNATGNLPEGSSIFRYNITQKILVDSNSSQDWFVTNSPTYGDFYKLNQGNILFSEIAYVGTSNSEEYVEIYNNLSWPVTLDGIVVRDYTSAKNEIVFSVSTDPDVIIMPRATITAGDDPAFDYNNVAGFQLETSKDLILYKDFSLNYPIDVVVWGTGTIYPVGPDTGWLSYTNVSATATSSQSLQRINSSINLQDSNSTLDWKILPKSPGSTPNYILPGLSASVLITEVMFNPASSTTGAEYIEMYNALDNPVDVSDWHIYRKSNWGGTPEITLPFGTTIPARTHFSVVENYTRCVERYNLNGLYFDTAPSIFTLDDGPGDAILTDSYGNIIDLVAWRSSTTDYTNSIDPLAWTDEGVYKGSTGEAIARLYDPALDDAYVDTNSSADWRYSVYPAPGNHTNNTLFLSTPFTGAAQVRTFSSPDNSYAAVVDLWRAAKNTIDVCVYQFTSDPLLQELVAAMNRGVQVRLLLQDIYPLYDSPYVFDSTHDPDNYQTVYVATQVDNNPNGSVRWASDYFAYTHAKYFIIDGEVVAMLTENFKATGVPSNPTYGNRGWGIAINNSQLAQKYLQVYDFDWNIAQTFNPSLLITGQRDTYIPTGGYQSVGNYKTFDVTAQFQTVVAFDDPINVIVDLLDSAKECIYIELFYLYPTWTGTLGGQNNNPFLQALIRAADRGVDVRVILDSTEYNLDGDNNNDEAAQVLQAHNVKVKWSNNSGGIEKFHVKALIVDNASVMIASLNWNENSATNNREIGVIVNSTLVAQYYVDLFFYDWVSLSTTSAPGESDEGPEPTYTWMWWLPVMLLAYVIVLLFGYIHRLSVEGTRVRNIPHVFSPSLKESIKPTTQAEKAPIHIEIAILRLKIQEIYGSAITVMQLKPYGTSTGENASGNFIRSYVRANHEFLQVGTVVNPTPYILIFKYSPEDYIGLESTLDLRPRAFEIKSLLTSAVRETVRLEKIKVRVDNMLREGN